MRTIEREIVSALIFSSDGKLLQAMKDPKKGGVYLDCWHIPGGGVEEGEDPIHALVREIDEELGLDISSFAVELVDDVGRGESEKVLRDTGEHVLVKMHFTIYKVVLDRQASDVVITLHPDEFIEYQWSTIPELRERKLTPPSTALFTRLGYI